MHWLDPDYLPETRGVLDRFVLNPKADVDGLLLIDGTEIHTPPHLSAPLLAALAPGAKLAIRGVKPRDSEVIVAIAIDPAKGDRIVDAGPGPKHEKPPHPPQKTDKPMTHSGTIARVLHGPKGHPHGVLLNDGVMVRFPPHSAASLADLLKPDAPLGTRGHSLTTEHGTVIDAEAIGPSVDALVLLAKPDKHGPKKPKKKPDPKHHDHPGHAEHTH